MAYGELKVDSITFTDGGTDTTVSVSGLVQNPTFSGDITVTGTISGDVILGGTTVSGATVTGTAGEFGTVTGNTAGFTTVTGTTVTGSTANFVSGTFTTQVFGATVTGNIGQFTTLTGTTAGFTTVTGTTVTGTTANFASGVFTSLSGTTATVTSGVFASGTAAAPSVSVGTTDNGLYSPGTDEVAISTSGTGRLFIDSSGNVGVGETGSSTPATYGNFVIAKDRGGSVGPHLVLGGFNTTAFGINEEIGAIDFWNNDAGTAGVASRIASVRTGVAGEGGLLTFSTRDSGASSLTEQMRLDSSGRLGLGTDSPTANLQIVATAVDSDALAIRRQDSTTANLFRFFQDSSVAEGTGCAHLNTFNRSLAITASSAAGAGDGIFIVNTGNVGINTTSPGVALHVDGDIRCDGVYGETDTNTSIQFPGSDVITFNEGGSEAARIDSSGRLLVGISTSVGVGTSLQGQLQIADTNIAIQSIANYRDDLNGPYLIFGKSRGSSLATYSVVQDNDQLGTIRFAGADGSDLQSYGALIAAYVDGTPGANDMPGRLVFSTTADGASSPTERMRIDSSGNLGLGTNSPQERLDVAGNGASYLRWEHNGVSGSYNTSAGVLRIAPYFAATDRELALFVDNSNAGWVTTGTNISLNIGTNKTSQIRLNSNGRVGVGTTSPAVDFDVVGKIRASTGILFGSDTADANVLDDYEEGTWTVTIYDALAGGNASASTATGYYTKIGRCVSCVFTGITNIDTTGMTAGNIVYVSLPFASTIGVSSGGSIFIEGMTLPGSNTYVMPVVSANNGRFLLYAGGASGGPRSSIKVGDLTSGTTDFRYFELTYFI